MSSAGWPFAAAESLADKISKGSCSTSRFIEEAVGGTEAKLLSAGLAVKYLDIVTTHSIIWLRL